MVVVFVNEYAAARKLVGIKDTNLILRCVECDNIDPTDGKPMILGLYEEKNPCCDKTMIVTGHRCHVLPCGHLIGASCLVSTARTTCRKCNVRFHRPPSDIACCSHPIKVPKLNKTMRLPEEDSKHLLPETPGPKIMAAKCRYCTTVEALRDLTERARAELKSAQPGQKNEAAYVTDGTIHGFLPGDCLQPFKSIDFTITCPVISQQLQKEIESADARIRAAYDYFAPRAENHRVGTQKFALKVGAWTKERSAAEARNKMEGEKQSDGQELVWKSFNLYRKPVDQNKRIRLPASNERGVVLGELPPVTE